jgi:probable addiction module antidote protein
MTERQKRKNPTWDSYVHEAIKDPALAAEYLTAAAKDDDSRAFVVALKNIIDVYGGLSNLARKANLDRASLHKALTGKGSIKFETLHKAMAAAGFEMKIKPVRSVIRANISSADPRGRKVAKQA